MTDKLKIPVGSRLKMKNNAAYFEVIDYTMGDFFIKCEETGHVTNVDYLKLLKKFDVVSSNITPAMEARILNTRLTKENELLKKKLERASIYIKKLESENKKLNCDYIKITQMKSEVGGVRKN